MTIEEIRLALSPRARPIRNFALRDFGDLDITNDSAVCQSLRAPKGFVALNNIAHVIYKIIEKTFLNNNCKDVREYCGSKDYRKNEFPFPLVFLEKNSFRFKRLIHQLERYFD